MMDTTPFRYAGFWRRFNAYSIDATVVVLLAWLLDTYVLGNALAQTPEDFRALTDAVAAMQTGVVTPEMKASLKDMLIDSLLGGTILPGVDTTTVILTSALYNIPFVASRWRATPGKHWLGIVVVMKDGRALTLLESTIRHIVTGVSIAPLGLGYITMFYSRQKLALHDMICNTRVVHR